MLYKTIQGDTWDIIAKRVYGNELNLDVLIQANADYREVVIFSAGVVLDVPEIEKTVASDFGLPPWKQGRG